MSRTRRFLASGFGRRGLPPLLLLLLIVATYWIYSWHVTTRHDPRDTWLGIVLTVVCFASAVYLLLRTTTFTPQLLGVVAFFLGDAILYGTITANRKGWATISTERQFDALRAAVTVAVVLYVGGIVFYETVQWRERRRQRREEAMRPQEDVPLYQGPERRGLLPGRRRTDR